mmetsp:Transcript_6971/g.22438  ORF Transcript_6971/g.22438 Transcript_6971/m.22438 type:complete len:212 (-) Transcript_6971:4-639(-)
MHREDPPLRPGARRLLVHGRDDPVAGQGDVCRGPVAEPPDPQRPRDAVGRQLGLLPRGPQAVAARPGDRHGPRILHHRPLRVAGTPAQHAGGRDRRPPRRLRGHRDRVRGRPALRRHHQAEVLRQGGRRPGRGLPGDDQLARPRRHRRSGLRSRVDHRLRRLSAWPRPGGEAVAGWADGESGTPHGASGEEGGEASGRSAGRVCRGADARA